MLTICFSTSQSTLAVALERGWSLASMIETGVGNLNPFY
jgi:hypothetical protein